MFQQRQSTAFSAALVLTLFLPPTAGHSQDNEAILRRWKMAQQYAKAGYTPIDCFAGQVRLGNGRRLSRGAFSVNKPDGSKVGSSVTSETDKHGHFVIEPLAAGEYVARFLFKGRAYVSKFAVMESYESCSGSAHIEILLSEHGSGTIRTFVDIDDSGESCVESQPNCFRR